MSDPTPETASEAQSDAAPASEPISARATSLGIYDQPRSRGLMSTDVIAIALSAVWLMGAVVFFLVLPSENQPGGGNSLRFIMTMLAIFMPVAMIWVAALAARASRVMREESQRLQAAIDAIRQAYIAQSQSRGVSGEPTVARKLDEIAAATRKTESTLATFSTSRASPQASPPPVPAVATTDEEQTSLELGTSAEDLAPPLANEDFIRAMNFPETVEDEVGFAALRRALKDRTTSGLIQAAQDLLTLLSQDGIYMDDLTPDRARPEIWRLFAKGARGREIAALGGVRDRSSLALTAGRMRQDTIFRDAAHHFLRKFDQTFAVFAENATDAEISALADTRTARAFMLVGRVTGTFN